MSTHWVMFVLGVLAGAGACYAILNRRMTRALESEVARVDALTEAHHDWCKATRDALVAYHKRATSGEGAGHAD